MDRFKKYISQIFYNNKGFSLIEILVAVSISSILIIMIYTTQRSIMFSIRKMTGVADFYENVNLALRRIDKDISSTLYNRKNKKLFFIGENDFTDFNNGKIHFVTINYNSFNTLGNSKKSFQSSDIKEVSYFLEQDPAYPEVYLLMRREAIQYDDKHDQGGVSNIILENVVDINFEFLNRSSYDKSWDSKKHRRFPKIVKTTLTVKNYQNKEEQFTFMSRLNMVK